MISLGRLSTYFKSINATSICPAAIMLKNKKREEELKEEIEKIKKYIEESEVKLIDETGFKMERKNIMAL